MFLWNLVDLKRERWEGADPAPGNHVRAFDFKCEDPGTATPAFNNLPRVGRSGTGVPKVDGNAVATQRLERMLPLVLHWDGNLDVGSDTGTPVNDAYHQVPCKFTGKVTLTIDRPELSPDDIRKLETAQRNNKTRG